MAWAEFSILTPQIFPFPVRTVQPRHPQTEGRACEEDVFPSPRDDIYNGDTRRTKATRSGIALHRCNVYRLTPLSVKIGGGSAR